MHKKQSWEDIPSLDGLEIDWDFKVESPMGKRAHSRLTIEKPNHNAFIERFNRTYRNEVLDLYLFDNLEKTEEATYWWTIEYNEGRSHDSLGDLTPVEYMMKNAENSTLKLSTK